MNRKVAMRGCFITEITEETALSGGLSGGDRCKPDGESFYVFLY